MGRGKTIQLYLMSGNTTSGIKCFMPNWTGVAYKIPRTMLNNYKEIKELSHSGVYFLFGTDDNNDPTVYIGQAGERRNQNNKGILQRIQEPHKSIDWTEVIILTTTNNAHGATEISFLESEFHKRAKESGRYNVTNSNNPNPGNVTKEKEDELLDFLDYGILVTGVLGHKVFEPLHSENAEDKVLTMKYKHALAKGMLTNDGFVIFKGSTINPTTTNSCPKNAKKSREKYKNIIGENFELQDDVYMGSPSAAAGFEGGASLYGNDHWYDKNNVRLGDLDLSEE